MEWILIKRKKNSLRSKFATLNVKKKIFKFWSYGSLIKSYDSTIVSKIILVAVIEVAMLTISAAIKFYFYKKK